jgi:hypothetical protein
MIPVMRPVSHWAKAFGRSNAFIYAEVKAGRLEAVRFGRCFMISEQAALKYIAANTLPAKQGDA